MSGSELTDEQARQFAHRWAAWNRIGLGDPVEEHESGEDLDTNELGYLLGWVSREMEREVERRHAVKDASLAAMECPRPALGTGAWDGLEPEDREALAHHIKGKLGGDFERDPHGEHGLAWTLCEAAGWPS